MTLIKDANDALVEITTDTEVSGAEQAEVAKVAFGAAGAMQRVTTGTPLPVDLDNGTFGYRAAAATGSVDVPTGARIKRIAFESTAAGTATCVIQGGDTITIQASDAFNEQIPGTLTGVSGNDVVFAGNIAAYYVSWVA